MGTYGDGTPANLYKRSFPSGGFEPPQKAPHSGPRIVAARITELAHPGQNPLGGLSVDDIHTTFSAAGLIQKIVCASSPKTGPPLTHVDAFVQFQNASSADVAVEQWTGSSLTGDGHYVLSGLQYSKHSELTVQNNNRCMDYTGGYSPAEFSQSQGHKRPRPGNRGRVVLARMSNLLSPDMNPLGGVTVETVHTIFSTVGLVEKIVCSSQPKTGPPLTCVDAMVQFSNEGDAVACIERMQGASLTSDGYFIMVLEFSRLQELHVRANNDRSWDFTASAGGHMSAADGMVPTSQAAPRMPRSSVSSPFGVAAGQCRVLAVHFSGLRDPDHGPLGGLDADIVHEVFGQFGQIEKIVCSTTPKAMPLKTVTALVQFASAEAADVVLLVFEGTSLTGDGHNIVTVQRSDRPELQVRSNSKRSWDYTVEPNSASLGGLHAYDPVRFPMLQS